MGLWENLSVLQKHLAGAMDSLEALARNGGGSPPHADDEDEDA